MSIPQQQKVALVKQFALKEGDTGSVEVQCAILTEHIKNLTEHFKINPKDFQSKIGLLAMVNGRKRLLKYLKQNDEKRHTELLARLGLKK